MSANSTGSPAKRVLWLTVGAAGCGVLTALPALEERLFPTAWLGLTLWIALTTGRPPHIAFRVWLLGGIAATATWFHWLPAVSARQIDVSLFAGTMLALWAIVWDAFRFGVFGFLVACLGQRGLRSTLVWPTVWVALEWVWPHVFPWRLGHLQLGWLSLCQIVEATGVSGLSFLLVWGAAIAAQCLPARRRGPDPVDSRRLYTAVAAFVIVIAACSGWGAWRISMMDRAAAAGRSLRVALVQPGSRDDLLPTLRRLTRSFEGDVDLCVWGESTIGDFSLNLESFQDPDEVRQANRFGAEDQQPCPNLGRPLLCAGGSFSSGASQTGPFRNTAYLIDVDGSIVSRYHKRVLMPWGEYAFGQQWIPGLRDVLTTADPLIPGETADPLVLPDAARLGVLICYEDTMPAPARETVLAGADVLINLNNLTVFGDTSALRQHQHVARFRSIETRRSLVRIGTTGSSAIISATGQVVDQLPTLTPATLVVDVPLQYENTIYTRHGNVLAGLCAAGSVLLLAHALRRRNTSLDR